MKNATSAISICALYFISSLPEIKTTTTEQDDHRKKNARGIMSSLTAWNIILNCWVLVTPGCKFPNRKAKGMAVQRAFHWDAEMVWKKYLGYWEILIVKCPQMIFSEHSCSVPSPEKSLPIFSVVALLHRRRIKVKEKAMVVVIYMHTQYNSNQWYYKQLRMLSTMYRERWGQKMGNNQPTDLFLSFPPARTTKQLCSARPA